MSNKIEPVPGKEYKTAFTKEAGTVWVDKEAKVPIPKISRGGVEFQEPAEYLGKSIEPVVNPDGKTVWTGEGTSQIDVTPVPAQDPGVFIQEYAPIFEDPKPRRAATAETIGFAAAHRRAVVGNDIFITVEATSPITSLEAFLDGVELINERFSDRPVVLERSFNQAGSASPGLKHCLKLRAYTEHGLIQTYRHEWVDSI